jgi:hypothetical protein
MDVTRRGKPTRMAGSGKRRIRAAIGLRGMPVQRFGERAAGENPLRPVCLLLPSSPETPHWFLGRRAAQGCKASAE